MTDLAVIMYLMKINILTLFPDFFSYPFAESMIKRAVQAEKVEINIINIRDFATDKHSTTDDRPFGGGPGMVMKVEPIAKALEALEKGVIPDLDRESNQVNFSQKAMDSGLRRNDNSRIILTSAKGNIFDQQKAINYSQLDELTIICGHYEGVDERVAEHLIDEEVRIGDYVLTGGEPAAVVIADAVTRLLPGVLGNENSNQGESHANPGQMGYPQYTRPENYNDWKVPSILLSGDDKKINAWREENRG